MWDKTGPSNLSQGRKPASDKQITYRNNPL